MKKLLSIIVTIVIMIAVLVGCTDPTVTQTDPFAKDSNATNPEVNLDGYKTDDLWSSDDRVEVDFATSHVTIVMRTEAIYLFFEVKDITPYKYVGTGDQDEVNRSDSIEFYFDTKLSRASAPSANCYQINLGRDGRTRIMSGNGGVWRSWLALYSFEVREGVSAAEYDYYYVEAMIPAAQMNITPGSAIGIAFGQVDRNADVNVDLEKYFTWTGLTHNGVFIEPQSPAEYLVISPVSLVEGTSNRVYTYDEYLSLTALD